MFCSSQINGQTDRAWLIALLMLIQKICIYLLGSPKVIYPLQENIPYIQATLCLGYRVFNSQVCTTAAQFL